MTHGVLGGADGPVRLDAHVTLDDGSLQIGTIRIRVSTRDLSLRDIPDRARDFFHFTPLLERQHTVKKKNKRALIRSMHFVFFSRKKPRTHLLHGEGLLGAVELPGRGDDGGGGEGEHL